MVKALIENRVIGVPTVPVEMSKMSAALDRYALIVILVSSLEVDRIPRDILA